MKLFLFFFLLALEALPLATSARPLFPPKTQQALAFTPPPTPPSSVNSFGSSRDLDSLSGSSSKKFSLADAFNKIKPASSEFRCHHNNNLQNNILGELFAAVTDLLRRYRKEVCGGKGDLKHLSFETCYAGRESSDVSPSIYIGNMKAKQKGKVKELFENELLRKFPMVRIEQTRNAIAIVMEDR